MTVTDLPRSAYPPPLDALMPKARALADALGEIPSRNRLMTELKVGAPKAKALRDALTGLDLAPAPVVPAAPDTDPAPAPPEPATAESAQTATVVDPGTTIGATPIPAARRLSPWPVLLLALPAFVAIWSGWVGLGGLTGFGVVHPFPGIWDHARINTAITLPIGVETYAAYALRAWLIPGTPRAARRFAKWSAIGSLVLGAAGQIVYHLMTAAGWTAAPWPVTALVSCLPVAVLGMGAALAHLLHHADQ